MERVKALADELQQVSDRQAAELIELRANSMGDYHYRAFAEQKQPSRARRWVQWVLAGAIAVAVLTATAAAWSCQDHPGEGGILSDADGASMAANLAQLASEI